MENLKVPQHYRYMRPIVEVLNELGGSGRASEVKELVVEKLGITDEELAVTIKSGGSRILNQMHWARLMLVKTGYLGNSQRGVWNLTEEGMDATLSNEELSDLYKTRNQWLTKSRPEKDQKKKPDEDEGDIEEGIGFIDYKEELLSILKSIPPSGFERICQRLLRESNFEQVKVTGKSGDGGIDGNGILQINPFVSFSVMFQCKRYQGTVGSSQIRDFRGAMMGRADKGIFITTGTFSKDAKKEARRDGVPPIELVDGEKLVEMFEVLELGLKPKKTYDIDYKFFKEFHDK